MVNQPLTESLKISNYGNKIAFGMPGYKTDFFLISFHQDPQIIP